jgi:hypothetical protein
VRKDFEAAVVTLREIEPAAANDVHEYDLDRLQTALKGGEQLLWVQAVTWKTDPDAPENAIDTWERGVLAVTSDRVVFSGYDASMDWVLDDLAGVQYTPGGRGIFGAPAAVLIRERRGDRFLFMPQQKHKNASSRLVSILEEQSKSERVVGRRLRRLRGLPRSWLPAAPWPTKSRNSRISTSEGSWTILSSRLRKHGSSVSSAPLGSETSGGPLHGISGTALAPIRTIVAL